MTTTPFDHAHRHHSSHVTDIDDPTAHSPPLTRLARHEVGERRHTTTARGQGRHNRGGGVNDTTTNRNCHVTHTDRGENERGGSTRDGGAIRRLDLWCVPPHLPRHRPLTP
jgi:hypothetical protein